MKETKTKDTRTLLFTVETTKQNETYNHSKKKKTLTKEQLVEREMKQKKIEKELKRRTALF